MLTKCCCGVAPPEGVGAESRAYGKTGGEGAATDRADGAERRAAGATDCGARWAELQASQHPPVQAWGAVEYDTVELKSYNSLAGWN